MCVHLLVSLLQKSSFRVMLQSSVCKNVPSDFAFPKHLLFICQNRANKTNTALSISIIPLIKAIFGLSGLEFCQKLQICMPNLVMLITHFGQKFKNPPPKCPSSMPWNCKKQAQCKCCQIASFGQSFEWIHVGTQEVPKTIDRKSTVKKLFFLATSTKVGAPKRNGHCQGIQQLLNVILEAYTRGFSIKSKNSLYIWCFMYLTLLKVPT